MADTRFIYGFHAIQARLRHSADSVQEIYLASERQDGRVRDLVKLAQAHGVRIIHAERARLDGMAGVRGARHQGVVARVNVLARQATLGEILDVLAEPALLLVLDGVQDPHNLGACLRVADAAGAHAVVAPKDRAVALNATAIKVASGAADSVPYVTVTNLARALREMQERGLWTVGADAQADRQIYEVDLKGPLALVVGAEGGGLRRLTRQTCDALVRIPMYGSVESLNVSVASGICLFEAQRQRRRGPVAIA